MEEYPKILSWNITVQALFTEDDLPDGGPPFDTGDIAEYDDWFGIGYLDAFHFVSDERNLLVVRSQEPLRGGSWLVTASSPQNDDERTRARLKLAN